MASCDVLRYNLQKIHARCHTHARDIQHNICDPLAGSQKLVTYPFLDHHPDALTELVALPVPALGGRWKSNL